MTRPQPIPVTVEVSLNPQDIAREMDDQEIVEFIKQLDDAAQDWDVTLALCEHFAALKLEHALQEAADAQKRREQP